MSALGADLARYARHCKKEKADDGAHRLRAECRRISVQCSGHTFFASGLTASKWWRLSASFPRTAIFTTPPFRSGAMRGGCAASASTSSTNSSNFLNCIAKTLTWPRSLSTSLAIRFAASIWRSKPSSGAQSLAMRLVILGLKRRFVTTLFRLERVDQPSRRITFAFHAWG